MANALVIALKQLNIDAEVKKAPEKIKTSICFNSSNWYELLVNNKKISGSAQRRFNGKVLQHGSILMDFDYDKNNLLFNTTNPLDRINNLKNRITSLKRELNNILNYDELSSALKEGFKENFNFNFIDDSLTAEEIKLAKKLKEEKYSTGEWNYRLSLQKID
jgi:lipoate-protein ligase A